jgi:ferric-dicitrate binding protein FerR (iron transport regulator)
MEDNDKDLIEALLPGYFTEDLTTDEKKLVDDWKERSTDNTALFEEYHKLWLSMGLLKEMEAVDTVRALKAVGTRIEGKGSASYRFITILSRVAAILFIPLLGYTLIAGFPGSKKNSIRNADIAWQTMSTGVGMRGKVELADGSHVTLNSGSEIQYPTRFSKGIREVKLTGEAFFEVSQDRKHPFIVNTGIMNVEVTGTTFNVSAYNDETPVSVILASGSVNLFSGDWDNRTEIGSLRPGQAGKFDSESKELSVTNVDTEKYLAWKDGNIIFKDDPMSDVIKRLERWFNVDIYVVDNEILNNEFTAKFHDETLAQVLTLIKLSSGIDYSIEKNNQLESGEFTRTKIYLGKK